MAIKYNKEFVKPDGRKLTSGGPRDLQRRQQLAAQQSYDQTDLINELKKEIANLSIQLAKKEVPTQGFTGEQVDEEVRKAVAGAIDEVTASHKKKTKELKSAVEAFKKNEEKLLKRIEEFEVSTAGLNNEIAKLKENEKDLEREIFQKNEAINSLSIDKEKADEKIDRITELLEAQSKKLEELSVTVVMSEDGVIIDEDRPQIETTFIDPLEDGEGEDLTAFIKYKDIKTEPNETQSKMSKLKGLMDKLPDKK